jgi:hypothetical protein
MKPTLHSFLLLFLTFALPAQAQTTPGITTLPLEVTAVCPGSVIAVPFQYTGRIGKLELQVSDGQGYIALEVIPKLYYYPYYVYGIIPNDLPKNKAYQVRVVSIDPDITGSISPSEFIIKEGIIPPKPQADSLTVECMRTSAVGYRTYLSVKILPGAKLLAYRQYSDGLKIVEDDNSRFGISPEWKTLEVFKSGYSVWTYQYPVSEGYYYFSQTVDGCESEKARTIFRELYVPSSPRPANAVYYGDGVFGKVYYCEGDKAVPLNQNGYTLTNPELYYVLFSNLDIYGSTTPPFSTTVVPVPDTSRPGRMSYRLRTIPFDPTKSCQSRYYSDLHVIVEPRPTTAPFIPLLSPIYSQNQPAIALTATTSSTATTLRWYLPDATGVPSLTSATAPVPPTNRPGSFTYLVSQVQGNCEGPKQPIVVNVITEDPALSEQVTVYPVPASEQVTVELNAGLVASGPAMLELINEMGRVVWQMQTRECQTVVPVQSLRTGAYNLRVRVGERQATKRVLKL